MFCLYSNYRILMMAGFLIVVSYAQRLVDQQGLVNFNASEEVFFSSSTTEMPITTSESSSQQPAVNSTIRISTTTPGHITTVKPTSKPNNAYGTSASLVLVVTCLIARSL